MTNITNPSAPVALVTGTDKGIGLETVRHLAGAGYRMYLTPGGPTGTFTGRDGEVPW